MNKYYALHTAKGYNALHKFESRLERKLWVKRSPNTRKAISNKTAQLIMNN